MRAIGRWGLVATAALVLVGCGRAATIPAGATGPATSHMAAAGIALTPEKAEDKARAKARAWRADATLVGVVWAVPKLELSSVVFHVFRGGKADELCVIETKLTSWWQKPRIVSDRKLALAAKAFAAVERWPIDAKQALAIAKAKLPAGQNKPIALLTLGRAHLAPPLWGVKADQAKVLIHAKSGKVLLSAGVAPVELLCEVVEAAGRAE